MHQYQETLFVEINRNSQQPLLTLIAS